MNLNEKIRVIHIFSWLKLVVEFLKKIKKIQNWNNPTTIVYLFYCALRSNLQNPLKYQINPLRQIDRLVDEWIDKYKEYRQMEIEYILLYSPKLFFEQIQ